MTAETYWTALIIVAAVVAGFGGRFAEAPWWKGAAIAAIALIVAAGIVLFVPSVSEWLTIPLTIVIGAVIGGALRMTGMQIGWSMAGLFGGAAVVGFVGTIITIAQTGV